MTHHISQFFAFDHLREPLRSMSARFATAHDAVVSDPDCGRDAVKRLAESLTDLPDNPEKVMCLRKMHVALNPGIDLAAQYFADAERELVLRMLLEAKDCAVRAVFAKGVEAPDICTATCDQGSACLLLKGHAGGHECQHGCIAYDPLDEDD